jgi:hypothetical protein
MNVALGTALRPTARATPSSKSRSMTWLRRAVPSSLRTRAARTAWEAGIIFVPGNFAPPTAASRSSRASSGHPTDSLPPDARGAHRSAQDLRVGPDHVP